MYGDTEAIRGLARGLRHQADEIRREADALQISADAVPWQGVAAEAMRAVARHRTESLRRTAGLHEDAARALDEHADEVDRIKRLIAAIEVRAMALVSAARERLAGVAGVVGGVVGSIVGGAVDPVDDLLDRFVPPPSGHRDWLTVRLPGLELVGLP